MIDPTPLSSFIETENDIEVDYTFFNGQGKDNLAPFRGAFRRMGTGVGLQVFPPESDSFCYAPGAWNDSLPCNHYFNIELVAAADLVIDKIRIYKSDSVTAESLFDRGSDVVYCDKIISDPTFALLKTIEVTAGSRGYMNNDLPLTETDSNTDRALLICPVDANGKFLPGAQITSTQYLFQ